MDMAQALVAGRELPVRATWRRILTAKTLALSALALAFIVIAVVHRRHLDASKALPSRQRSGAAPMRWPADGSGGSRVQQA